MLTRNWDVTGALLSCAAMLALSAGCSSSSRGPEGMTASRPDAPIVAAQHETRDPVRVATYDADRTAETAEPRSTMRTPIAMAKGI